MTSEITIRLQDNNPIVRPNAQVKGICQWKFSDQSKETFGSAYLLWFTEGIGTQDVGIVASQEFPITNRMGEYRFTFTMPESPLSIESSLISILWAVECVIGTDSTRAAVTNSPWEQGLTMLYEDEELDDTDIMDDDELEDEEATTQE
jgi:hypothetical protein